MNEIISDNELAQNFNKIYQQILPQLELLERRRLEISIPKFDKYVKGFLCFFPLFIGGLILLINSGLVNLTDDNAPYIFDAYFYGFIHIVLIGATFAIPIIDNQKRYNKQIKKLIFPHLLKAFETFEYQDFSGIYIGDLETSGLFKYGCDFKYDDNFSGIYKGMLVDISEISSNEYKTTSDTNYNSTRDTAAQRKNQSPYSIPSSSVATSGLLINIITQKPYRGHTIATTKAATEYVETIGLENVYLEDTNFRQYYNLFSTDQIEARYIFTTSFTERFQYLKRIFKSDEVRISIRDNSVLILIMTKDLFEVAPLKETLLSTDNYFKFYKEFSAIFQLIDVLKLGEDIGL